MRRMWGVAVSTAALAGIAGCGSSSGGSSSGATAPAGDSGLLLNLTVSARQLGDGWRSQTYNGGDVVKGQVTLDLCGARYPSESLRVARHQVLLTPADADSGDGISNEVVLYRPGGAQQARTELLQAIATCPSTPVKGALADEGMLTFEISTLPADARWLPGTVAVDVVVTDSSGESSDSVEIFQFHGDTMSGIYGSTETGRPTATELQAAADAATLLSSSAPASS